VEEGVLEAAVRPSLSPETDHQSRFRLEQDEILRVPHPRRPSFGDRLRSRRFHRVQPNSNFTTEAQRTVCSDVRSFCAKVGLLRKCPHRHTTLWDRGPTCTPVLPLPVILGCSIASLSNGRTTERRRRGAAFSQDEVLGKLPFGRGKSLQGRQPSPALCRAYGTRRCLARWRLRIGADISMPHCGTPPNSDEFCPRGHRTWRGTALRGVRDAPDT
jgi:hypothetical protein